MSMSIIKVPLGILVSSMRRGDEKFNNTHRTFGNFNVKKDLNYLSDGEKSHMLDIMTNPKKRNGILLFYIHGGGYVHGYKEHHRVFTSWFVDQGFDVVAINYRLGEKDGSISIMEQVKDALDALKFVEENKHHYGIDTKNLFLVGDSAGGHICLLIDLLSKNKEIQEFYQIASFPKVNIKGIALNSPMYDFEYVRKQALQILTKRSVRWMLSKRYIDDEFIKKNNPRYYFKNGFKPSPLFASTSYHDYFNSQTMRLRRDCEKYDISLDYLFESSTNKKIGHVYNHFCFEMEEGKKCNNRMVEFFLNNSKVAK